MLSTYGWCWRPTPSATLLAWRASVLNAARHSSRLRDGWA